MKATLVGTNLCGRWVQGRLHWHNPDYVFTHDLSKKEIAKLSDLQKQYYLHEDHTGQIVAVTIDTEDMGEQKLRFWILIEGRPKKLTYGTVMPEGWSPPVERL